ncbi:histone acetyltransferase [Achlya hypogyna]|uniref:histone acetyltransferase n=1 Tax=Achlya hypogyna TaxID=1202772 RepID=A0A1V9Z1P2_ACHHY|nr:histone acetyltransferase [Achlya hypogyna]
MARGSKPQHGARLTQPNVWNNAYITSTRRKCREMVKQRLIRVRRWPDRRRHQFPQYLEAPVKHAVQVDSKPSLTSRAPMSSKYRQKRRQMDRKTHPTSRLRPHRWSKGGKHISIHEQSTGAYEKESLPRHHYLQRYQQTPSASITHIVDLCLSFLGNSSRTSSRPAVTGSKLWKQFANADMAQKLHSQQLKVRWQALAAPLLPLPTTTIHDIWETYVPANMAECLFVDKMRRAFTPLTIRRKVRTRKPKYQIQGHHIKEYKPRKRARTDAGPAKPSRPPSTAAADSADLPPSMHDHASGMIPSLPDGWTRCELDEPLRPVRPFASMSRAQIELHVQTLKCDSRIRRFRRFLSILSRLMEHARNVKGIFNAPVDHVALNLPTYPTIVPEPMDLGTVKKALDAGEYATPGAFAAHVRLVFTNAMRFNGKDHWVHVNARFLLNLFEELWGIESIKEAGDRDKAAAHACRVCAGHTCAVCDEGCLELTLPHYQCFGNCGTVFRKGMSYFVSRDGTRMWCMKCRNRGMKEEKSKREEDGMDDPQYPRGTNGATRSLWPTAAEMAPWLSKKKCEVDVEPWVRCSECDRWMHQVCVLFNGVEDAYAAHHHFVCPLCLVAGKEPPLEPSLDCTSLPESEMSRYLQQCMRDAIPDVEARESLFIRASTFPQHKFFLPASVVDAFASNAEALRSACPDAAHEARELPARVSFTTKSIFLFQKQQGVDVCLFAMYVQEYSDDCELQENRRSAYLAYIDSVRYLQPAHIRTLVYHNVLLAYFDYSRHHGLDRIHIWSCPPQRSQSYVFWCHPHFQKTPGVEHLRSWYKRVLQTAKERHIISGWTTLFDRYLAPLQAKYSTKQLAAKADVVAATAGDKGAVVTRRVSTNSLLTDKDEYMWPAPLPYFEGDLVPSELDRVIRQQKAKKRKKIWSVDAPFEEDLPGLHRLKDTFAAFLSAMKVVKEDLLVVDLTPPTRPLVLAPVPPAPSFTMPPFIGSRFSFHQLSLRAAYQFDSLRRAKHSTMMLLHQMFNHGVPQANVFCAECALLITHAVFWRCRTCTTFALCDWCHRCHGNDHPHRLSRDDDPLADLLA